MAYNPWYTISYEPILDIANWKDYCADTEKKIVAIFSWMPLTIMSIRDKGKRRKCEMYDNEAVTAAIRSSRSAFEAVRHNELHEFDIDKNSHHVGTLCEALFPILGSVASSKYLHFSAPRLFPMWDRQLRLKEGLDDKPNGYVEYMRRFKLRLAQPETLGAALAAYPANAVRGLDIICMGNRVDHALFAWGKTLKPDAKLPKSPELKAGEKNPEMKPPLLWGQDIPRTGIVPASANVLKASEEYVGAGSLDELPKFKRQNLRDLQLHEFPQFRLRELLREPGGRAARELLHYYKETMGGNADIMNLPRPIRDVFLVGWANCCGINGTAKKAKHLYKFRFGGTERAAIAVVTVGKSTGRLFGLLDDSDTPTALFHEYFEL